MAKFFIECPHCGTSNQASTFIFAKKVIKCGHCKEEIDVKANRMASRKCPHCDNVFVFDQKKDSIKCPACHQPVGAASGKIVSFPCPECGCILDVSNGISSMSCPVCDQVIDVSKEAAKAKLVSDSSVSVIKYEGGNDVFIWKHPIEDFNLGSQLIVHQSQEAIFFLNVQMLDTFGPGRYTLETESLPVLNKVQKLPTGRQNPFHAEVYFVNKTVQMNLLWGVGNINFREPSLDVLMTFGAFGSLNLQVSNARVLLEKLVGTTNTLSWTDSKEAASSIKELFGSNIKTTVKSTLPRIIKDEGMSIIELDERLEEIAQLLRDKLSTYMEEFGLIVPKLFIDQITLPKDDPNFKTLKVLANEKLMKRTYEYQGTEAEAQGGLEAKKQEIRINLAREELEMKKIEAEAMRIKAQAEAETDFLKKNVDVEIEKRSGLAQAEVMQAQGYNKKDEFAKDVQLGWASGIGNMGSGGSGGGGGMMSEVLGMGAAMAAMGNVSEKMSSAMKGLTDSDSSIAENVSSSAWTCSCGHTNEGKFCSECGAKKPESWDCSCGKKGNTGKFCAECGSPRPESWDCSCGKKDNKGKFCPECGAKKEDK